jgi:hypothetical protein
MTYQFPERWKAESVEVIDVEESFGKIFKLSNVSYTNREHKQTIHIPGKTYIGLADFYIWHFLYDSVAQFCYLKTKIKDLNPFFISPAVMKNGTKEEFLDQLRYISFHVESDTVRETQPHKYFEDLFEIFITQDNMYNLESYNFTFEEVYFVYDNVRYFNKIPQLVNTGRQWFGVPYAYWINNSWESRAHLTRGIFPETWWRSLGILEMRNIFLKKLKENTTETPKKIFLSRKDANGRYKERGLSPTFDRHCSDEVDETIEDFFVSKGYYPIVLEGMGYLEQLNYFKNATHIAGIVGSAFCQTLVCNPSAVVSQIMVNKRYDFTYQFISEMVGYHLNDIDLRTVYPNLDKIKLTLETKYNFAESVYRGKNDQA